MATLVKTSKGGFNLDNVTDWRNMTSGEVWVYFNTSLSEGQSRNVFSGQEAERVIEILEGVTLFDTTSPRQKG